MSFVNDFASLFTFGNTNNKETATAPVSSHSTNADLDTSLSSSSNRSLGAALMSNESYQDIRQHYKNRKMNELHTVLNDPDKWRDFQDLLHANQYGYTNSSVKENLLTTLRRDYQSHNSSSRRLDNNNSSSSSVLEDDSLLGNTSTRSFALDTSMQTTTATTSRRDDETGML